MEPTQGRTLGIRPPFFLLWAPALWRSQPGHPVAVAMPTHPVPSLLRAPIPPSRSLGGLQVHSSIVSEHAGNNRIRASKEAQCMGTHDPLKQSDDFVEIVERVATVPMSKVVADGP